MLDKENSYCSSIGRCGESNFKPKGYCLKCSHANWYGECEIDGKAFRWIFNPYMGPVFLGKRKQELKWFPGPRHPVWPYFNAWIEKYFRR